MFKIPFFSLVCILLFCLSGISQSYRFKIYDSEKDGIYPYIYSIHQDSIGFLWLGTGEGLFRFDGHAFKNFDLAKISGDNFISASCSSTNGINWFGHNNGKITVFNGIQFKNINLPIKNPGSINSIIPEKDGSVWVATQNAGICKISSDYKKIELFSKAFEGQQIYCINLIGKNILVGTGDGLYVFNKTKPNELIEIKNSPTTKIECIYFSKFTGNYYFGTEDAGIYSLTGLTVKEIFTDLKLAEVPIKDIECEPNGNLWIATMGKGLINIPFSSNNNNYQKPIIFDQSNGLKSTNIKKILFDREQNIWIGTYGSGLATFFENYFTFILNNDKTDFPVTATHPGNNCIWAGTNGKLIKILSDQINLPLFFSEKNGIPNDKITSLYLDNENLLWIGTDKKGIFIFDIEKEKAKPYFISDDQLINSISSIDGFGENIFIGTHNGLIIINKTKNTNKILTTIDGLPHNFINHIITDVNANVWIATPTNYLCCYNNYHFNKIKISTTDELVKINSLNFDIKGNLWIATYGNGVYVKTNNKFKNYNTSNGLLSEYCYSIISDETGTVWVGHRQGISSIFQTSIQQFGINRGITNDCNINANCIDNNGIMWLGTSNGILRYDFRKNAINRVPPVITINSIKFNDTEISSIGKISMPYSKYKVRVDFSGITFRNPEMVTYKYMLEGYDQEWSEQTYNNFAIYPRLDDGEYTLLIKAYNSHGICNSEPFKIEILIEPPLWKKWWFILLCFVIILYGLYLFIKIRERNHRRLEEILQQKLDERTHEVVLQKELIEQKNKDITDSINYAKRIQEAILPTVSKLHSTFNNSFVYYQPRDIVSGDFYVFHQTEDTFILICADATGHGVPGAFMSLICSTILKDILNKKHMFSPSQILYELDKELQISLQTEENTKANDGLDVAVCLFNLKTNEMVFSSAMRPLLLFQNNKLEYIRGSKFSIGASQHFANKEFKEHNFKLQNNDCIYLFTDGVPDQFGGENGKKLKISGLQKWIAEINSLPMNEQHNKIISLFNSWKAMQAQIDDVLFIGIKYKI